MIPWWLKIVAKILLSRIPMGYRFFSSIRIFRHGAMQDPEYALNVFLTHFNRVEFERKSGAFVGLEIGVGDSVASAIIASAHGASACYLIDSGRYADDNVEIYAHVVKHLQAKGLPVADIDGAAGIDDVLSRFGGTYLVDGLRSLQSLPDSSVDFVWSQAVLEHIRCDDFDAMMAELYRVVRPGGCLSHRVDLRDHLGGALNNRRIASTLWEEEWFAKSGFYTNRISYTDMLSRFEAAGFAVDVLGVDRWDVLPTPRSKMAAEFSALPDEELLVSGFDVILRR